MSFSRITYLNCKILCTHGLNIGCYYIESIYTHAANFVISSNCVLKLTYFVRKQCICDRYLELLYLNASQTFTVICKMHVQFSCDTWDGWYATKVQYPSYIILLCYDGKSRGVEHTALSVRIRRPANLY